MPVILLTRPAIQSRRFAAELRHQIGPVEVTMAPIIEIRYRPFDDAALKGIRALIFTSENGVAGFAAGCARRDLNAYCVGPRTALAAQEVGFSVTQADGDVEALLHLLVTTRPPGPLLHLRGVHTTGDLSRRLCAFGLPTSELVVYEQLVLPLSAEAKLLLEAPGEVVVPLFSPRSAHLLTSAIGSVQTKARLLPVAISANAAAAWAHTRYEPVRIAARPDAEAILDVIKDYFDMKG